MTFSRLPAGDSPHLLSDPEVADPDFLRRVLAAVRALSAPPVVAISVRGRRESLDRLVAAGFVDVVGSPRVHRVRDDAIRHGGVMVHSSMSLPEATWVHVAPGLSDREYEVFAALRADGTPFERAAILARGLV